MKTAGIILVIFSGAGLGFSKSRELTEHLKILENLYRILFLLKGEIRCTGAALEDAFSDTAGKMSGEYRIFLNDVAKELAKKQGITFGCIFGQCARKNLPIEKLSIEEQECFLSLGEKLGYLDKKMQVAQIELLEEEMQDQIRNMKESMPKKKKVYQSIGILGGIFLAVLFW